MIKLPGIIQKIISKPAISQFIKFGLVGVLNTIVSYVIYFIMLRLGFFYVVAATAGTVAGTVNSYILNKLFVFKSKKKSVGEIIKFIIVYAVQYLVNIAVIHIFVAYVGFSEELAGIPAIGVGVCISFFGHKFWSFRSAKEKSVDIKDILIGYTGFVGSNLHTQHNFSGVYNSSNIKDAFSGEPDLCVYSGVRAEKFLANTNPNADMALIENAIENIKRINPKRLVLISTIDVFKTPHSCDENTPVDEDGLHAYGYNRRMLEKWCRENVENSHILRLPGLFGANIKKNFIYDMIRIIPSALNESKYKECSEKEGFISSCYSKQDNGFYMLKTVNEKEHSDLLEAFGRIGFSALNFTDSRAVFQFYNLAYLWEHIEFVIKNKIKLLHMAVEPVKTSELYQEIRGGEFINEITAIPPLYDFKTIHAEKLGGGNGYIFTKQQIISEIKEFFKHLNG